MMSWRSEFSKSPRRKVTFAIAAVVFVALAALYFCNRDPIVAVVGERTIKRSDVRYRNKIVKTFYPQEKSEHGLDQLVRSLTEAQIMANYHYVIDDRVLRAEEVRINQNTKDPAMLLRIKEIFGTDMEAYRRDFILPTLVDRTFHDSVFNYNSSIQSESRKDAEVLASKLASKPKEFEAAASQLKLSLVDYWVSQVDGFQTAILGNEAGKQGFIPPSGMPSRVAKQLDQAPQGDLQAGKYWLSIIKSMKPGDIQLQPFEVQDAWLIARYDGPDKSPEKKSKKRFLLKAMLLPKIDFQTWYDREAKKVSVVYPK